MGVMHIAGKTRDDDGRFAELNGVLAQIAGKRGVSKEAAGNDLPQREKCVRTVRKRC